MPAMVAGMVSAFTGQLVAYPFEVVARRMQCGDRLLQRIYRTKGSLPTMLYIARKDGMHALYSGIGPASLKVSQLFPE